MIEVFFPKINESEQEWIVPNEKEAKPTVVLHMGLPKTGTTTLQRKLFANIQDIYYFGRPYLHRDGGHFFHHLLQSSPSQFSHHEKRLDDFIKKNKVNMISEETLWGDIFKRKNIELLDNLEKLQKKYNLKVIVTTRIQANLIISMFLYLRSLHNENQNLPFEKNIFINDQSKDRKKVEKAFNEMQRKNPNSYITNKCFDYLHLYKTLNKFIPSKNLLFIPMEGIFSQDYSYRKQLFHFITGRKVEKKDEVYLDKFHEYKENKSPDPNYIQEIDRYKRLGYPNRIFDVYKKSNQHLQKILGMNFKLFGYF